MTDLLKLAERCQAATGPDRMLDEAIQDTTGYEGYLPTPAYTASIDAAMTLVPEHYHPSWLLRKAIDDCLIAVGQSGDECMRRLPLFICAAALRARSEAAAVGGR